MVNLHRLLAGQGALRIGNNVSSPPGAGLLTEGRLVVSAIGRDAPDSSEEIGR